MAQRELVNVDYIWRDVWQTVGEKEWVNERKKSGPVGQPGREEGGNSRQQTGEG